jgi:hypothetical protein
MCSLIKRIESVKEKHKDLRKRIISCLVVAAFNFHPLIAKADGGLVVSAITASPPQAADEIVKNIRAIADHGDLADEQYYAEKLGVVMVGNEIGSVAEPDSPCGLGVVSKRERMIEQQFYYKDVPWYFTSWFGRNQRCDRPYAKAFLSNGLIEVVASLMIDAKKVCVTQDDLKKYFKTAEYVNERGGFKFKYSVSEQNVISVEATSPSSMPKCAVYVNFFQNRI